METRTSVIEVQAEANKRKLPIEQNINEKKKKKKKKTERIINNNISHSYKVIILKGEE